LSALTDRKRSELAEAIRQRREFDLAAAQAVVATNIGKQTMDEMRVIVARMEAREDELLAVRAAEAQRSYQVARWTRFATTGLALIAVLTLFIVTYRHGAERKQAMETAQRLAVTLASIGDAVIATDDHGCVLHIASARRDKT
jgi:PAS domain-containing protein